MGLKDLLGAVPRGKPDYDAVAGLLEYSLQDAFEFVDQATIAEALERLDLNDPRGHDIYFTVAAVDPSTGKTFHVRVVCTPSVA